MVIEDSILLLFKPWILGYCNCGCGKEIPVFSGRGGKLRFYVYNHHLTGKTSLYWKGGKTKGGGYILVWMPEHPNASKHGYVREHILIMSEFLGRPITRKEIVHHINERKDDNRIENLQLLPSRSEHRTIHNIGNKYGEKDKTNWFCSECGSRETYIDINTKLQVWRKNSKGDRVCSKCYHLERSKKKKRLIR